MLLSSSAVQQRIAVLRKLIVKLRNMGGSSNFARAWPHGANPSLLHCRIVGGLKNNIGSVVIVSSCEEQSKSSEEEDVCSVGTLYLSSNVCDIYPSTEDRK